VRAFFLLPQLVCFQGFSGPAVGLNNPAAETMVGFHPDAPGRAVEKHLDGPCKMKPPRVPAAGLIG
jgi:hypothetical protein